MAGHRPSNAVLDLPDTSASVDVAIEWEAAQPIDRIEIVRDGEVAAVSENPDHATSGQFFAKIDVSEAGWAAARCWGRRRTSYGHALWAHTSPVYLRERPQRAIVRAAASSFIEHVDQTREWLTTRARFDHAAQRDRVLQLYAEGRAQFERLAHG